MTSHVIKKSWAPLPCKMARPKMCGCEQLNRLETASELSQQLHELKPEAKRSYERCTLSGCNKNTTIICITWQVGCVCIIYFATAHVNPKSIQNSGSGADIL